MEETKHIFENELYNVSINGKVFSNTRKSQGRELKQATHKDGYKVVWVYVDGKRLTRYVHRLVAMAFCEGYEDDMEVNHKDLDKTNNHYRNLEWVTKSENSRHRDKCIGKSELQKETTRKMGKKWGTVNGSLRTYNDEFIQKVVELRETKLSFSKIGKKLGCSLSTAYRLYMENK